MLSTNVKTISELLSIALNAEREAIRRYSQLASNMHDGNNESVAALFERLVREEQEHEHMLQKWMKQEGIDEDLDTAAISWHDPNVSTTYNDEAGDPYYSSPYKALAFAVHNEEIAFRFYTHLAANAEDETIQKYAEVLAREELGHAALLRAERRRAYHTERDANITEPALDPKAIHNEADLLAAAIHIDLYLANQMHAISSHFPEIDTLVNEIRQQINHHEHTLKDKASPGTDISSNIEQHALYNARLEIKLDNPELRLQRISACCDRSFAFYDAIVEMVDDETVMLTAQKLTALALDRIGIIRKMFARIATG